MNKDITPEIMLAIQDRSAIGHSCRQIRDWLLKEYNITYSYVSVSKVINKSRSIRQQISEDILRPILEKRLTNDMEILDEALSDCRETIAFAKKNKDKALLLKSLDRLDKFLRISFKVKGVAVDDTDEIGEATGFKEMSKKFNFIKFKDGKEMNVTSEGTYVSDNSTA